MLGYLRDRHPLLPELEDPLGELRLGHVLTQGRFPGAFDTRWDRFGHRYSETAL